MMNHQQPQKKSSSIQGGGPFQKEIRHRIAGYIAAAFGLVASLAWNEAIGSLIEYTFPLRKDSLFAKFIYAILATLLVVVVTLLIVRVLEKDTTAKK